MSSPESTDRLVIAVNNLQDVLEDIRDLQEVQAQSLNALSVADRVVESAQEIADESQESDSDESEATESTSDVDDSDVRRVREYLEQWTPEGTLEHVELSTGTHDGQYGVVIDADLQSVADKDRVKSTIKDVEGASGHYGFDGDPCPHCGEIDDEWWYFYPPVALKEVAGDE